MSIVIFIASLALIAFVAIAGLGKIIKIKSAKETFARLGLSEPAMSAFGGLELGAALVILISVFYQTALSEWVAIAAMVIIALYCILLVFQVRASEPTTAKIGPLVVIALAILYLAFS